MPRYSLLLLIAALAAWSTVPAGAQNLVPNYSFELRNACPTGPGSFVYDPSYTSFPYVQNWISASAASPDYFNGCAPPASFAAIPLNGFSYRTPRTGDAYGGVAAYQSSVNTGPYTEYIETKLTSAVLPGHTYHLHFYCSASSLYRSAPANQFNVMGVDKIGALFSGTQISNNHTLAIVAVPSVSSPAGIPITDTLNWTRVSGFYTPLASAQWLILGRFNDGQPMTQSTILPFGSNNQVSYYFYEDVVLKDVLTPDLTRAHNSTLRCGAGNVVLNGPAGADEYSWSNGSRAASITVFGPGTWWVRSWTDTTYAVDTFRVTRAPTRDLHLPADQILCPGTSYTIVPNYTFSTYRWSTGATTPTLTVSQPGTYALTVTDSCGTQTDTITLTARPLLQLPDTAICPGDSMTVLPGVPFYTYLWSTGATTPSVILSRPGMYALTVTDACGAQQDSFRLSLRPTVPPPGVRDTAFCRGAADPKLHVTGDSLRWYTSPTAAATTTQPAINTANLSSQTLYVSQTRGGCESALLPVQVAVVDRPVADLGPDTVLCRGYTLLLGPSAPGTGATVRWSTGQTYSPIQVTSSGYYVLTVTNGCGSAVDEVLVTVTDCDSNSNPIRYPTISHDCLVLPTAFTPNNDGRNDRFRVSSHCDLDDYNIRIYNRWGALVYEGHQTADAWDGTVKGSPAAGDTYFYLIRYLVSRSGNVYDQLKGDLLLVR